MTVLEIVMLIICAIGIKMIFDTRSIVEEFFSSNEKIATIKVVKIVGTITTAVGLLTLYIIK